MKVIISDDGESNVLFSNIPKKGTIPFLFSFSSSSVYLLALSQHKSYFELFFFSLEDFNLCTQKTQTE